MYDKTEVIQSHRFIALLYSIIGVIQLSPYYLWGNISWFRIVSILLLALLIVYFVRNRVQRKAFLLSGFALMVFLVVYTLNINGNNFINFSIILLTLYFLLPRNIQYEVFNKFYNLFVYTLIPGLILYFFIFLGVDLDWSRLEPSHNLKELYGYFYRDYGALIVLNTQIIETPIGEFFRFSAIYDEPGRVGTVCGLLLVATNVNLGNWRAKILLLSGVISLSLAFYAIILLFSLVKRPKIFIMVIGIILLVFLLFSETFQGNLVLDKYFFSRIDMLLYSIDSVDNRSSYCFDEAYSKFISSPQLLSGNGFQASNALNCGVSTHKTVVYDFGLIGSFLILTIYFLMTILNINKFSNIFSQSAK